MLTVVSQATQDRAKRNSVDLVETDHELCNTADYILSIVPPRDALATAKRVASACSSPEFKTRDNELRFLDLNAISPRRAREINELFAGTSRHVQVIDGGIIGGPPRLNADKTWYRPRIPLSGPLRLSDAQPSGDHLADTLNVQHVNDIIGSASGLKMCFASLTKGYFALAVQSFTTAHNLGVLDDLKENMEISDAANFRKVTYGLTSLPPKAYRWVDEMKEIASTFEDDGLFDPAESSFRSVAQIYDLIANNTELGEEKTEDRKRGKTAEDVALLVSEGTHRRKLKTE